MSRLARQTNLRADASRLARQGGFTSGLKLTLTSAPFRTILLHRLAHRSPAALGRLIAGVNLAIHGADIDPRARIGPGVLFQHPVGVVVGGGASLGAGCTVMSGVVLGRKTVSQTPDPYGYPKVGDRVLIGTGSVLLGPITVGSDATVGACSLVLTDVAAAATVVGSPAVPISR